MKAKTAARKSTSANGGGANTKGGTATSGVAQWQRAAGNQAVADSARRGNQSAPQRKATPGYEWIPQPAPTLNTTAPKGSVTTYLGGAGGWTVAPDKSASTLDDLADFFDGLGDQVTDAASSGFASFLKVALGVTIPIPEVPGLLLPIKFDGTYVRFRNGKQELNLKASVGVKWSLFDLFSISISRFAYLNLVGVDLGEAFIDALKQSVLVMLKEKGIDAAFTKIVLWRLKPLSYKTDDLIEDLTTFGDASTLIAIAKLTSSTVSRPVIAKAYTAYREFFSDDPNVGFEVAMGRELSAGIDLGSLKGNVSREDMTGIEDPGNDIRVFDESAVATKVKEKTKKTELTVRLSKRDRDDSRRIKLEIKGIVPGTLVTQNKLLGGIFVFLKSEELIHALTTGDSSDLQKLGTAASVISILTRDLPDYQQVGIELSLERTVEHGQSSWKANARLKQMLALEGEKKPRAIDKNTGQTKEKGIGKRGIGVEASVQYGTLVDLSKIVEGYLKSIHDAKRAPLPGTIGNQALQRAAARSTKKLSRPPGSHPSRMEFVFQTFIVEKYVPGTKRVGLGDDRNFGKPGDSYRTFQKIILETDPKLDPDGVVEKPDMDTAESKTTISLLTGHASAAALKMEGTRRDGRSMTVHFSGSIQNGAKVFGQLSPAIDFNGVLVVATVAGERLYALSVSHDAFPAYEAFLDNVPIYRWRYRPGSSILNLIGSGTAVRAFRKTGDAAGTTAGAGVTPLLGRPATKGEPYIVKQGDNLSSIALRFLGDETRGEEIYEENQDVIGEEKVLRPGMQITVHRPVVAHTLAKAMYEAMDPRGGLIKIEGAALEYFKKHQTTHEIRKEFEQSVRDRVDRHLYSRSPRTSIADVFARSQVTSYGGDLDLRDIPRWLTLGTWLLSHCYPEVRYTVKLSGNSKVGWTAAWAAVWIINDNLDLVGGDDKSEIYKDVSIPATYGWHDLFGGRRKAWLQVTWNERGVLYIPSPSRQFVAVRSTVSVVKPAIVPAEDIEWPKTSGALGTLAVRAAKRFYDDRSAQYTPAVLQRIGERLELPVPVTVNAEFVQAVGLYQREAGLQDDGKAGLETLIHMFGKDIRAQH